eukprot:jgi/Mesvir1/9784/Mv09251-RA.1
MEGYLGPHRTKAPGQRYFGAKETREVVVFGNFFNFPHTVNRWSAQLSGLMNMIICILCIIFRNHRETKWVVLFLLIDYSLRVYGGGKVSVIGSMANLIVSPFPPRFVAGPPKQFAQCIGCTFAAVATLVYFLREGDIGGAIVLGLLAGASGLEGFLDFCLGCFFFGLMVDWGLFPKSVYREHIAGKPEVEYMWNLEDTKVKDGPPKTVSYPYPGKPETKVDAVWKQKTDSIEREDFNLIRHCKIFNFSVALSALALAVLWKLLSMLRRYRMESQAWHVLAIYGTSIFTITFFLYLAKAIFYHKKVVKEFGHVSLRNGFMLIPGCFWLACFLAVDWRVQAARALWWMGFGTWAPLMVAIMGEWLPNRHTDSQVTPTWMYLPMVSFLGACMGPLASTRYTDLSILVFGAGMIVVLLIMPHTFSRAYLGHNSDDRERPHYFAYVAVVALFSMTISVFVAVPSWNEGEFDPTAYLTDRVPPERLFDYSNLVSKIAFGGAMLLFIVFGYNHWRGSFFGTFKFNMAQFGISFPLTCLAFASMLYDNAVRTHVTIDLSYCLIAAATGVVAILHCNFYADLILRRVWRRDDKWSSMSFMKLTHEAFREFVPKLQESIKVMRESPKSATGTRAFLDNWAAFYHTYRMHSQHEDKWLFPAIDKQFPRFTESIHDKYHHVADEQLEKINALVGSLDKKTSRSSSNEDKEAAAGIIAELGDLLTPFLSLTLEHLACEELTIVPIVRKYLNDKIQRKVSRAMWAGFSNEDWGLFFSFALNHLPHHNMRVRLLRSFLWHNEEYAQFIGTLVYRGVDEVMWARLTKDVPEIIPRGTGYRWRRYN